MKPVTVALLVTLLPTLLIILFLACFSVYLYVKLHATRVSYEKLQMQLQTVAERQPEPAREPPLPVTSPELPLVESRRRHQILFLSEDASKPEWRRDCIRVCCYLGSRVNQNPTVLDFPGSESWVKERLEDIGYNLAPAEVIMKLLREPSTRSYAAEHIALSVALANTDLESESPSTVLSFSPELRRDLLNGSKALEGMTFSQEFSNLLSKLPSQIIADHGALNESNLDKIVEHLHELMLPFTDTGFIYWAHEKRVIYDFAESFYEGFIGLVTIQLRMLASRQRFKFKWGEISESSLCVEPALCAYSGEDGVPLDEPKVWFEGETINITDDGSISYKKTMDLN